MRLSAKLHVDNLDRAVRIELVTPGVASRSMAERQLELLEGVFDAEGVTGSWAHPFNFHRSPVYIDEPGHWAVMIWLSTSAIAPEGPAS